MWCTHSRRTWGDPGCDASVHDNGPVDAVGVELVFVEDNGYG